MGDLFLANFRENTLLIPVNVDPECCEEVLGACLSRERTLSTTECSANPQVHPEVHV